MSKLSHTPGPWHYVDYSPQFNGCFPVYDIRDDNVSCVAEVVHTESDARLMTASPDMLDVALEGYELSRYAACSKIENTEEFLTGLFERIELYQSNCKRVLESATGLPIEEVLK